MKQHSEGKHTCRSTRTHRFLHQFVYFSEEEINTILIVFSLTREMTDQNPVQALQK